MTEHQGSTVAGRAAHRGAPRAARKRLVSVAAVTVLAVVGGAVVSSPVVGQDADDVAGRGPAAVALAVGGDASSPKWPGCSSEHCRHLSISLQDAPAGVYDIECWSSRDSTSWYSSRWHWPASGLWTEGGCWFGYPGEDVWVVVGGTKSNVIRWGQASTGSESSTGSQAAGRFVTVTTSVQLSCGLRADGGITCWGDNLFGQTDVPPGRFSTVSTAGGYTCGLRTDGTIACWGTNRDGQTDVPDGHYTAVSVGPGHSCGLRTDGTIACWGWNSQGQIDVPDGRFSAVVAGLEHSCGLRTDGTITCWGVNSYEWNNDRIEYGLTDAPAGRFSAITTRITYSCGLRTDGTIACWGWNQSGYNNPPTGQFSAIIASWDPSQRGYDHWCGLRTDGTIACWGHNGSGQADAPAGRFSAVAAGHLHTCGLRTDGTIACWGYNEYGQTNAPSGQFTAIAAHSNHSCGVRTDGTITCWGRNVYGQTDAPTESLVDSGGGLGGSSAVPEYSAPGPPLDLRLSHAGDRLSIRWDAPRDDGGAPVTGYVVRVSRPRLSSSIGPAQRFFERQSRSLQVSNVHRGTTYTVSVRAQNSIGSGAFVSKEIFTSLTLGPPEVGVEQEGRTFWIDDPDAVVIWDRVIGAVAYDIDWRYMEVDIERLRRVYGLLNNPGLSEHERERRTQEAAALIDGEEIYSRTLGGDSLPDLSGGIEARCSVVSPRNLCHNFVTGRTDRLDADDPSYRIHSSQPDKLLQVRVRAIGTNYSKGAWSEWAYHPASRFNVVCQFLDIWNRVENIRTALDVAGFILTVGSVVGAAFSAGTLVAGAKLSIEGIKFAAREIIRVMLQSALSRQFIVGLVKELVQETVEDATLKVLGLTFGCVTHGAQLDRSDKRSLWEEMIISLADSGIDVTNKTKVIQSFAFFEID